MPLNQFIRMLQSLVNHSDNASSVSSDHANPLHAGLDGILLTGKWCNYKYHEQLPNVVSRTSCADLEASIMLFVFERHAPPCTEPKGGMQNSLNDKERWLAEIEKRE